MSRLDRAEIMPEGLKGLGASQASGLANPLGIFAWTLCR